VTADRVRLAEPADVPKLVRLMIEFYAESDFTLAPGPAARTFALLLAEPRFGRVWLMECGGRSAGYVVLTVCFSMEYGGLRGFVDDFFVRASCRRRGLGTAALAEVRRAAEVGGVRALLVETGPLNEDALAVYHRSGFRDSGHLLLTLPLAAPVHDL